MLCRGFMTTCEVEWMVGLPDRFLRHPELVFHDPFGGFFLELVSSYVFSILIKIGC